MERKNKNQQVQKKRANFFDNIEFPTDIMLGDSIMMMCENRSLQLQNVKGMIECKEDKIRLLTRKNRIDILGKNLNVKEYSKDEILIKGYIEQILYLEK